MSARAVCVQLLRPVWRKLKKARSVLAALLKHKQRRYELLFNQHQETQAMLDSVLAACVQLLEVQQAQVASDLRRHAHLVGHLAALSEGTEAMLAVLDQKPPAILAGTGQEHPVPVPVQRAEAA